MKLWGCLEKIEDPRNTPGRRYKLGSIMKLLVSRTSKWPSVTCSNCAMGKKFKRWGFEATWL